MRRKVVACVTVAGNSAGTAAGLAAGNKQGHLAGYTAGYNAAARKANGGLSSAFDDAYAQGADSVFTGLPPFNVGSYYIVKVGPGQTVGHGHTTKYGLQSSLELQPGQSYNMCPNSSGICGGPLPG